MCQCANYFSGEFRTSCSRGVMLRMRGVLLRSRGALIPLLLEGVPEGQDSDVNIIA